MAEVDQMNCPLEILVAVLYLHRALGNYLGGEMYPTLNLYFVLKTGPSHLCLLGVNEPLRPSPRVSHMQSLWWHPRAPGNLQLPQDCSSTSPGLSVNPNNLTPSLVNTSQLLPKPKWSLTELLFQVILIGA